MNILLIGGGGREHAMAWKIGQSPLCERLYIAPGNAGTGLCGENININPLDKEAVGSFVLEKDVQMVVVGPEEPLVKGLGDYFSGSEKLRDILFVGPSSKGARIEGSKSFAKEFMQRHGIPTAAYRSFTRDTVEEGVDFLKSLDPPYVLKADGLAAGKGVIICSSEGEAVGTLMEMLCEDKFGEASSTVVIEEFLEGVEMSVFVITDGRAYTMLPSAKDYKRVGEKDTGANTGGMGAVSPVPFAGPELMGRIEESIIKPTVNGLYKDNIPYCGFIFFGLMISGGMPYVIEYNVRLGDPEAEVILPRLESDLVELMQAACRGRLSEHRAIISPRYALTVILASGGYPGDYKKGFEITGKGDVREGTLFYSGVKSQDGRLLTSGGRVIAVTSLGGSLEEAMDRTYRNAAAVDFRGMYYRRDIGRDLLKKPYNNH